MHKENQARGDVLLRSMGASHLKTGLLAFTAMSAIQATSVHAQDVPAQEESQSSLEEIIVTATRQASTINRVPLSISASTQEMMDRAGIQTAVDLQRMVPALRITQSNSSGVADISIRGITANTGAATTGVYLDDTPLQKRSIVGGGQSGTGTPMPPLFDLERVEVLRGPQGTLYGGSSQGGTIRFITPAPSLTDWSGYARAGLSVLAAPDAGGGGPSDEAGVAVGGPIIEDKLGFRASLFGRHTAGYVDVVDPYNNGAVRFKDANSTNTWSGRLAVAWKAGENTLITATAYHSDIQDHGGPNNWLLPQKPGQTYTTTSPCFDTRLNTGRPPPAIACPAVYPDPARPWIYQRPAATYGPFDYLQKPYQSFAQNLSPGRARMTIASLTIDHDFHFMNVKSITSYIDDSNLRPRQAGGSGGEFATPQTTTDYPNAGSFELSSFFPDYGYLTPSINRRHGIIEELRFSSVPDGSRFSWIGGLYYSDIKAYAEYNQLKDTERYAQYLYGMTSTQAYGAPYIGYGVFRSQPSQDTELAAFGEMSYQFTNRLKLIAGARISRVMFDYTQYYYGSVPGFNDPTADPRGITLGKTVSKPFTPKLGVQYQFTEDKMAYFTAAKGFRAGGVNPPPSRVLCATAFADAGMTAADVPDTYGPDMVWSYELGTKLRMLGGRMQVNASIYQINWDDLQQGIALGKGCAPTPNWTDNVGKAQSRGFDLDTQMRLFSSMTLNMAVGYTHAVRRLRRAVRSPCCARVINCRFRHGRPASARNTNSVTSGGRSMSVPTIRTPATS
ncbi:MAG: TonB-dependent receptor [Steroidobacteraceae bacterium]